MDIIDENKYREFKNILSGCKTITDARYFGDLYIKRNPESKRMVISLLNGKKYGNKKDIKTFQKLLEKCVEMTSYEIIEMIQENYNLKDKDDDIQIRTLMRVAKYKKGHANSKIKKAKNGEITKNCPYCNHTYSGTAETTHVICGYNDNHSGYDWNGCQRDWCFSCGKKLCKSWDENKLWLECNRIHNNICCHQHAEKSGSNYESEYCKCSNKYVHR
jgi:hypothetical protein